jgi:hypothetical protein
MPPVSSPPRSKRHNVTFLLTGTITWTSPSGKNEERKHVRKGDVLNCLVCQDELDPDAYTLRDAQRWSLSIDKANVQLS